MAEPFLSEIRIMSFVFPPKGWALCDGQLLPINQNQALFSLLGTTYGGDGRVNFGPPDPRRRPPVHLRGGHANSGLPDLRGRPPIHMGSGHTRGERGGEQGHTLSISEIPTHTHVFQGTSNNADDPAATAHLFATSNNLYAPFANPTSIQPSTVAPVG